MTAKLPTIKDLSELLRDLKPDIGDDYRGQDIDPDDPGLPCMTVTIGWSDVTGGWSYQTGDNSFYGRAYHYSHWAVVDLYRRSNTRALARDIRSQLIDRVYG